MNDLYAAGLAESQKPNDIDIHERHFRQVQNKPRLVVLELLFQFPDVLRLKEGWRGPPGLRSAVFPPPYAEEAGAR